MCRDRTQGDGANPIAAFKLARVWYEGKDEVGKLGKLREAYGPALPAQGA
jgi:hypothetical protein